MAGIRQWARRARLLIRRSAVERAMDAEMREHLEHEIADRIRQGLPPEAARRSALRDFGGVEQMKEASRDARGFRPVEDLARDVRFAGRVLRRNPGFTAAAVLTFALGIGAATAIFSVVYGVLLRPLPYARPDRLAALWERQIARHVDQNVVSADNFDAWRTRAQSFEGMVALMPTSVTIAGDRVPERVPGAEVSPGYFHLLGVPLAAGRDFTDADARADNAVILSDALWRRRYGADPSVVGRGIPMGARTYTVVGVAPPDFDPPAFGWLGAQELWFPLALTEQHRAWGRFLLVVGRLKDGTTLDVARAELSAIADHRASETSSNVGWSASAISLARQITGESRASLLAVFAGVALLLLMAVTNVATLTSAAMQRRGPELAVRRALGATDGRLFRQLFVQSAVLAAIGTAAGLAIAAQGVRLLVHFLPPDVPRASAIRVDAPVLLATSLAAILATVIFGSLTALRGRSHAPLVPGAESGDGRATSRSGGGALVTAEIALGLALSVMAVLMAQSFIRLRGVNLGFESTGVLVARVAIPSEGYATPERQRAFFDRLRETVTAVPGVRSAGLMSIRPFGGLGVATTVSDPRQGASPSAVADIRFVDPSVFPALRIHLSSGAVFDRTAEVSGPAHVVVSATLARALWPGQEAVGRNLALELNGGIVAQVSGVADDVHLFDPRTPPRAVAYLSDRRYPSTQRDLVVQVDGDPSSAIAPIRSAVAGLEATLPIYQVAALSAVVDQSLASDRFTMWLLAAFAVAALLLASVGIFSVFSGDVSHRRKEIGIRLALGATGPGVAWLLLGVAWRRTILGVGLGAALAFVLARGMQSLLFGIEPSDPLSFLSVTGTVVAVATIATLIPLRPALRLSPVKALREG